MREQPNAERIGLVEECKLGILGKCMDLGGMSQMKNLDFEVMKNMIFSRHLCSV